MTEATDFVCPRCTSRCKLVRVRAEPGLPSLLVHCRVCKESLAPTDGEYALKYFLVNNGIDLRMKHPTPGRRSISNSRSNPRTMTRRSRPRAEVSLSYCRRATAVGMSL
jgi:hypothetical protein